MTAKWEYAMPYKLTIPKGQIVPDTACFYRIHLGHRKNAAHLAANLIRKAAEIEKSEPCDDPLLKQFENIVERWALYTIFQGLYIREYHEWERAVKNYIYDQRIWNGISGDFDWKSGRKSFVKRTIEALTIHSA
jgi:hypothetical protein